MTRKNDTSPVAAKGAQRSTWTPPRMRRLMTSAAAFNGSSPNADGEGFS